MINTVELNVEENIKQEQQLLLESESHFGSTAKVYNDKEGNIPDKVSNNNLTNISNKKDENPFMESNDKKNNPFDIDEKQKEPWYAEKDQS